MTGQTELTTTMLVPVTAVRPMADNHRSGADEAKIERLAAGFADVGQLQPIMVYPLAAPGKMDQDGYGYGMVFGSRRLAAAGLAGWDRVLATVLPARPADAEIQALRAIENLEREDLTPIEEGIAVERVVAAVSADGVERSEAELTDAVATRMNRAASWVRDRLYLSRLGPKARRLVTDGRLPVRYAREIAKIGDPSEADRVADAAAADADGFGLSPFYKVQNLVRDRQHRLDGVPWELATPFAGRPACEGCPDNSAAASALFEHDDGGPARAVCLKPSCFKAKQSACDAAIAKGVEKIRLTVEGGGLEKISARTIEKLTPKGVKATTLAARARGAVSPPKKSKGVTPAKPPKLVEEFKLQGAAREHAEKICREWDDRAAAEISAWMAEDPMRLPAVLFTFDAMNLGWGQKLTREHRAMLDRLATEPPEAVVAELAAAAMKQERFAIDSYSIEFEIPDDAVAALALWLCPALGPAPDQAALEKAYLAERQKPEPAAAPPAGKKAGKKTATRKTATKKTAKKKAAKKKAKKTAARKGGA